MVANKWSIGIDFGTSNTAAAHTNPLKGTVEAVGLNHDRTTMPSSVYVESPDRIDVGDVAFDKAENNPAGFLAAPKRVIPQQMLQLNGYDISASKPVAAVLAAVVQRVSREHANVQPFELVLTHPEAWSSNEINVLLDAAQQLGLTATKITTISEPQAAAHYYSQAKNLVPGQRIAVFDFGGGTLDVAVLEAKADGSFDVVAARGDNALGGKNFDALMRQWVDEQLEDRNPELLEYFQTQAPLQERHALEDSIRRAKELLSEASYATVVVSGRAGTERFQITRGEFESLIATTLDKAVELAQLTLADAGSIDGNDLVALYLTGGSSRIPMVQERLKHFGPVATLDDPKTVVAQGAIAAAKHFHQSTTPSTTSTTSQQRPTTNYTSAPANPSWVPSTPSRTNYGNYSAPAAWAPGGSYPHSSRSNTSPNSTPASWNSQPFVARPARFTAQPPLHQPPIPPPIGIGAKPKKSSAKLSIAAIIAVVVFGVGRYIFVNSDTDDSAAEPTETPVVAAHEVNEEVSNSSTYQNLPEKLKEIVSNCELGETTYAGNAWVKCDIKADADSTKYFYDLGDGTLPKVEFVVDADQAATERDWIANGSFDQVSDDNVVVENDNKTVAVRFSSTVANGYSIAFASTDDNLILRAYYASDPTSGEEFLKANELM